MFDRETDFTGTKNYSVIGVLPMNLGSLTKNWFTARGINES